MLWPETSGHQSTSVSVEDWRVSTYLLMEATVENLRQWHGWTWLISTHPAQWCNTDRSARSAPHTDRMLISPEPVANEGHGMTELPDRTSEPSRRVATRWRVADWSRSSNVLGRPIIKGRTSVIQTLKDYRNDERLHELTAASTAAADLTKNREASWYNIYSWCQRLARLCNWSVLLWTVLHCNRVT